jgi:hypothetical protein
MKFCFCLFIFVLFSSISTKASDKPKQDGKALIEEAENKVDIFALSSFEIKGHIQIENLGKMVEGSYQFFWNGPEEWREEINLPGYTEIQVGGKGVVFLKRTTDFLPLRIYQPHSTLGYGAGGSPSTFVRMGPSTNETIKKIHDRSENGQRLSCVEIESVLDRYNVKRDVCVDQSSGTLIRQGYIDKTWMPIGDKSFPRFLSYVEDGKPLVEVQVTELKTTERWPPSTFGLPVSVLVERAAGRPPRQGPPEPSHGGAKLSAPQELRPRPARNRPR